MVGPDTLLALVPGMIVLGAFRLTMGLQRPDPIRRYWKGILWSPSYFAASPAGAPSQHPENVH